MDNMNEYLRFYKMSLTRAGDEINTKKQTKALKDVVGKEYEEHRKRVWEYFGFVVDKDKNDSAFDVDWSIYYNDKLVALEEDKGHYVDSCFLERCLGSFAKTINNYSKKGNDSPNLILSSFTKYSKYDEKLEEELDILKPELSTILKQKMKYQYLNICDRYNKKLWFQQTSDCVNNPYDLYQNEGLIRNDIQFMLSLKD